MRNLFLLLLAGIGLSVFGYFDQQKHAAAAEQAAADAKQLEILQSKLESAESDLKSAKSGVQERADYIINLEETKKKELADAQTALTALQAKLDEAAKPPATEPPAEEAKKPMAEVEELRTKLAAAETALAQAKTEAATALAQATAKAAEVQRLQQLQARPPLGSAMKR